MRAGGLSILSFCLVACGDHVVHLSPPSYGGLSVVLATQADGAANWQTSVHDNGASWSARVSEGDNAILLGYPDSLETLGLRGAGSIDCRVRHPELVMELASGADGWTWRAIGRAPDTLIDTVVGDAARCRPCSAPEMRAVAAPHTYRYLGGGWLEDGDLIGVFQFGLARIGADEIEVLPACPGLDFTMTALAGLGSDRFLIGGSEGELATIQLTDRGQSCVVETSTAMPMLEGVSSRWRGTLVVAADPTDPGAFDYYSIRNTGDLYHWTASGLAFVGTHPLHPNLEGVDPPSLLRLDSNRLMTAVGSRAVHFWENDQMVEREELDLPLDSVSNSPRDRVTHLQIDARANRYLVGTAIGQLWARPIAGGDWSAVFQAPVHESVGTVIELSDRYFIPLDGGDAASWGFDGGECDQTVRVPMASNGASCRLAVRRGDRIALIDCIGSSASFGGVVWFEP